PAVRSRRRPATSWLARAPGRSSRRRRSLAFRCSMPTDSGSFLPVTRNERGGGMTVPVTIDPVRQARAYQEMLVGLVGKDDPAEVQRATSALVRNLLAEAADDLRLRPAQAEWSVLEA